MCVCVCVCEREGEGGGVAVVSQSEIKKNNVKNTQSIKSVVFDQKKQKPIMLILIQPSICVVKKSVMQRFK